VISSLKNMNIKLVRCDSSISKVMHCGLELHLKQNLHDLNSKYEKESKVLCYENIWRVEA
jgi:hypothetical protein